MLIKGTKAEIIRKIGNLQDENSEFYYQNIRFAFTGIYKDYDGATYNIRNDIDPSQYFTSADATTDSDNKISRDAAGAVGNSALVGTIANFVNTTYDANLTLFCAFKAKGPSDTTETTGASRFSLGRVNTTGNEWGISVGVDPTHVYITDSNNEKYIGLATDDDANPYVVNIGHEIVLGLQVEPSNDRIHYFCYDATDGVYHYDTTNTGNWTATATDIAWNLAADQWTIPKCKTFHGGFLIEHSADLTDWDQWKADVLTMAETLRNASGTKQGY